MRKKKWVAPFLENENKYLISDLNIDTDKPIYLEIGMGMGDFITNSANLNPDTFYVGLEKEATCVARAIKKAEDLNLDNFRVLLADAVTLDEICKPHSIDKVYLHFSDPWPKKRQNKRRLTYMPFLSKYEKILKADGILVFKTDNQGFFDDSLEYFKQSNFKIDKIDRNYINENEPMTAYQAKFTAQGKPIYFASLSLGSIV